MANKYCNLDGSKKIKDEYQKINIGFDKVEEDVNKINDDINALDERVDKIITTPIDGEAAAQELVDARGGRSTLSQRLDEYDAHLEDNTAHGLNDLFINVLSPPASLAAMKCNANYFNSADDTWYVDSGFTTPADDDTTALLALIAYIKSVGKGKLIIPKGKRFLFSSKILIDFDNITIDAEDVEGIYNGTDSVAFEVVNGTEVFWNVKIIGNLTIKRITEDWTTNQTGVRLVNCNNCRFEINAINFTEGVVLEGNGQGFVFNKIFFKHIANNKTNLIFRATNNGWCNDNNVFGGALTFYSGRAGGYADTINVKVEHYADHPINNNRLWGVSFESASADTKAIYCEGTYNYFYSCRFETSVAVEFSANSANNVVFYGNNLYRTNITDNGSRNCFYTREGVLFNGGTIANEGAFKFRNSASYAYPAISVVGSGGAEVIKLNGDGSIVATGAGIFDGGKVLIKGARGLYYSIGSPEGVVTAAVGSLCINGNGGAGTTLWVKEGGTGNTGWVAK